MRHVDPRELAAAMQDPAAVGRRRSIDLMSGAFVLAYHREEMNRCPGCGRSHWWIGRTSAECAFCGTVLPLDRIER